jgi:DNA-binding NarL/FixJ family response regulator
MLEETATGNDRGTAGAIRVLGYPAHDLEDLAALEMLRNLLDPSHWNLEVVGPETLTAELLDRVAEQRPDLLCLMATPPGGLAHTRYLCKRLRARFPDLKILVCRWARVANHQSTLGHLVEAGADVIAASLMETRQQLASLRPVLAQKQTDREETHRAAGECAPRNGSLSRANERRRASGRDVVETAASS